MQFSLNQRGIHLVSLMVSVAILAILVLALIQLNKSADRSAGTVDSEVAKLELRNEIISRSSCDAIKASETAACNTKTAPIRICGPGGCTGPTADIIIALPVGSNYTLFNGFWLRAQCVDCPTCSGNKKILVEALRSSSSPVSGNWSDLSEGIPFPCVMP